MAFEKERKINSILMVLGIVLAVGGFAVFFLVNHTAGIVMMIAGVALLVITSTISGAFFKIDMNEMLEKRK